MEKEKRNREREGKGVASVSCINGERCQSKTREMSGSTYDRP